MSRELKFRVWLQWRENDPWRMYRPEDSHGCFHIHQDGGSVYNCTADQGYGYGGGDSEGVHASVVMQFTGLKDKNGKEIYEGDVVQYKDLAYSFDSEDEISIDVVTWGDDEAAWMLVCAFSGERQTLWDGLSLKKSEVIGNIHENPELVAP